MELAPILLHGLKEIRHVNPEIPPNFADLEFTRKKNKSPSNSIALSWSFAIAVGFAQIIIRESNQQRSSFNYPACGTAIG